MLKTILDKANFNIEFTPQEDVNHQLEVDTSALYCFFLSSMEDVVDDEVLRALAKEASVIDTHNTREFYPEDFETETPRQFINKVNQMRLADYDLELTPSENVFSLGWVTETEDDYVTPEGAVPKDFPGAKALAFSSRLNPAELDSPTISGTLAGLPHLEDSLPSFTDGPVQTVTESTIIEDYLSYMTGARAELYKIIFQPRQEIIEQYPDLTPSILFPFNFVDKGEGTIFYAGGGISPEKFGSLARWLLKHHLVAPPMYCSIAELEGLRIPQESVQEGQYSDEYMEFDGPEVGGYDNYEDHRDTPITNFKSGKDPRLVKYTGPKWRSHLSVRGKKTVLRAPLNPLLVGKQKDVKKAYPHIAVLLGKVNPRSVKTVASQIGRFMTEGCDLALPFQKAIYAFALAAKETGASYKLAGAKETNPYETAILTLLLRSDSRFWTTSRDDGVIVIRGRF
jgi:hypothetical protein